MTACLGEAALEPSAPTKEWGFGTPLQVGALLPVNSTQKAGASGQPSAVSADSRGPDSEHSHQPFSP